MKAEDRIDPIFTTSITPSGLSQFDVFVLKSGCSVFVDFVRYHKEADHLFGAIPEERLLRAIFEPFAFSPEFKNCYYIVYLNPDILPTMARSAECRRNNKFVFALDQEIRSFLTYVFWKEVYPNTISPSHMLEKDLDS